MKSYLTAAALVPALVCLPVLLAIGWVSHSGVWGAAFLLGLAVAPIGLVGLVQARRWLWFVPAGLVLSTATAGLHGLLASMSRVEMHVVPTGGSRWLNYVVPEREGAIAGAAGMHAVGAIPPVEQGGDLVDVMHGAYGRLHARTGPIPTPAPATWLGWQRPESFDLLVVPGGSDVALLFLHGSGGGFTVYCEQMSQIGSRFDWTTACPSVGPQAYWDEPAGVATVRESIAWLRDRGSQRIVLVGLSAGAQGAHLLANALPGEFEAVVLISGCTPWAPPPGPATLIVEGDNDVMARTDVVRTCQGPGITYRELPGGHYLILSKADEVNGLIGDWLEDQVVTGPL